MVDIKKAKGSSSTFPASIEMPDIQKSIENPFPLTGQLPITPERPPKKTKQ